MLLYLGGFSQGNTQPRLSSYHRQQDYSQDAKLDPNLQSKSVPAERGASVLVLSDGNS